MNSFDGKVVLITGAARGIGAETARVLARRDARLILTDLDAEPLEALAAELGEDRALGIVCDVCDLESMERAAAEGVERFGGIDLVLANAGIASYGSALAVDPAVFRKVLDVNVLGVFHTVRATLSSVMARKGYYLIVSSEAAFAPSPGLLAYNASKAGVEHTASALRLEVAQHGVGVGIAHMSWIDTPLVRDTEADLSAFGEMLKALPWPLGEITSVDKCAAAFVTGLEQRKRRVYVPEWVRFLGWLKPVITSPLGERQMLKHVPRILAQMDAEVAELGRSTSARNVAMDDAARSAR